MPQNRTRKGTFSSPYLCTSHQEREIRILRKKVTAGGHRFAFSSAPRHLRSYAAAKILESPYTSILPRRNPRSKREGSAHFLLEQGLLEGLISSPYLIFFSILLFTHVSPILSSLLFSASFLSSIAFLCSPLSAVHYDLTFSYSTQTITPPTDHDDLVSQSDFVFLTLNARRKGKQMRLFGPNLV